MYTSREAGKRVALKQIIRMTQGYVNNEAVTKDLEKIVILINKSAPAVVARKLDAIFKASAKSWENGNNSGDEALLVKGEDECERQRLKAEDVLSIFGIETDYPGLYPSFKLNGYNYHSTESVLRAVNGA
jgi:hypothetical protein